MNPAEERRLIQALVAVRLETESKPIPGRLEAGLLGAFRARRRARRMSWSTGALAIAASVVGAWFLVEPPQPAVQPPSLVARAPAPPEVLLPKVIAKPAARRKARPRAVEQPAVTDFVSLPYAPPFEPYDRGQVMRVRLPRQSLRSMGFPVNPERWMDRVQADVLMGEDGVVRAVRFVK